MTAVTDDSGTFKMETLNVRGLATALALVILCAAGIAYANRVPVVGAADELVTEFSASRAMQHDLAISRSQHPIGSKPHDQVRDYLMSRLAALGLSPQVQATTGVGTRYAVAGRVENVLVRIPGKTPGRGAVLLMAHYDAVPASFGAGDDGAGTVTLLETLRALTAGPPLLHDVIALFTDGEEAGLLGAAAFVREHPWAADVGVVMNFEARGTSGPSLMFETGAGNLDVVRVLRGLRGVRATSLSTTVYRQLPNDTDLSELMLLQTPAMNFAFIGGVDRYHTAEDDFAHLDARSVQHHGNQALAMTRAFANGPMPRPKTSDAVFFNFPGVPLIVYPERWAFPLAVVGLALVIAIILRLRQRGGDAPRGIVRGVIGVVATIVFACVVGIAFAAAIQRIHGALGSGTPGMSGIYAIALALLVMAIAFAVYLLVRRGARAHETAAHVGALVVWSLVSLAIAWKLPGVSFVFTWPLIVMDLAALAITERPGSRFALLATWVGTAIVVAFLVPTVYLMACVALGLVGGGAVVLALFTALGLWLLSPHLEAMRTSRAWIAPTAVVGAALILFLIGVATVRTDVDHPAGASMVYAVDADSGTAWLSGYAWTSGSRTWLNKSLHTSVPSSRGDRVPAWLSRNFGVNSIVTAPLVPVGAATAVVVGDSLHAGTRTVTLRVRPAPGTHSISMAADSGAIVSATVDGNVVDTGRNRSRPRRWTLEYVAPPDSGFTLALTMRESTHPVFTMLGAGQGIPALPGVQLPVRPPGIIPIQEGDMTWVYRRMKL